MIFPNRARMNSKAFGTSAPDFFAFAIIVPKPCSSTDYAKSGSSTDNNHYWNNTRGCIVEQLRFKFHAIQSHSFA
jgi:hypothetical protein